MKKSEEISFGEDRNQSHRPELLPEITSLRRERETTARLQRRPTALIARSCRCQVHGL